MRGITDAAHQFEDVETTVSHAYGAPNAWLGGRTYGAAFFDRCAVDGLIPREGGAKVLEIGCGTGRFARAWLDRFREVRPEVYAASTYTMFDLSPALAASQRELCRPHAERITHVVGNVETDAIGESFDTILCNEVIADLSVDVVSRDDLGAPTAGAAAVRRYGLDLAGAMDRFLVNTGALTALARIAAALRPGGGAVVTEYGSRTGFPRPAELAGHTEHSIHFGHLEKAARVLGLDARCEPLPAFLGFDVRREVLSWASTRLLREAAPRLFGHALPALAYDRPGLRVAIGDAFNRLGNLRWVPLADDGAYLAPSWFEALSLRKSGPDAAQPTPNR